MPLREGTLRSLISTVRPENEQTILEAVFAQMLKALDYLANNSMCHRDVKPDNILYYMEDGNFIFQLADFGFAKHQDLAVSVCGTGAYEAIELHPDYGRYAQSPKMDVWSLFATMADVYSHSKFRPANFRTYADVLNAVRAAARDDLPDLAAMVRENPEYRASAAQLLVMHFDGKGLTTRIQDVPPLRPLPAATTVAIAPPPPFQLAQPSTPPVRRTPPAIGPFALTNDHGRPWPLPQRPARDAGLPPPRRTTRTTTMQLRLGTNVPFGAAAARRQLEIRQRRVNAIGTQLNLQQEQEQERQQQQLLEQQQIEQEPQQRQYREQQRTEQDPQRHQPQPPVRILRQHRQQRQPQLLQRQEARQQQQQQQQQRQRRQWGPVVKAVQAQVRLQRRQSKRAAAAADRDQKQSSVVETLRMPGGFPA